MNELEEMEIELKKTIDMSLWNQCQEVISNYQMSTGEKKYNQVNSVLALKEKDLYIQMIQDIARIFYTDANDELIKNICASIVKKIEKTLIGIAGVGALGIAPVAMYGVQKAIRNKSFKSNENKMYTMKDAIKIFTIYTIINDPSFIKKKNEYFVQKNGILKDKADDIINEWQRESELFISKCKYGIIDQNMYNDLKSMFTQIPEGKRIGRELKELYIKLCDLEIDLEVIK